MNDISASAALSVIELAPAKINLALHVTGQRADGYHLLDTLVAFANDTHDRLVFSSAEVDGFALEGRFGSDLSDSAEGAGGNLVLKARDILRAELQRTGQAAPPVHIRLEKNLPIASGIGGGSTDAAATLRGLTRLWNTPLAADALAALALKLGADVPMCLASRPVRATGIGEMLQPVTNLPVLWMVLANPLTPVPTPAIFRKLTDKNNTPLPAFPVLGDTASWTAYLERLRNDLEPPARDLVEEIGEIAAMLSGCEATLVRMSGSGATCYGLFPDWDHAAEAAAILISARPDWYFEATSTIPGE